MKKTATALMFCCMNLLLHAQQPYNLLVGTYTGGCKSEGIYLLSIDAQKGSAVVKSHTKSVSNPSFLSLSPDGKKIYAVNEDGAKSGVSSFDFDAKSGGMLFLNRQDSKGADACHVINDAQNVLVANYSGGTISVFKKQPNGSISPAVQTIAHEGKSVNKERQSGPHVHQLTFSPDQRTVLANDLGTDRIYLYNYQPESTSKVLTFKDSVPIKSGSGPRHLTFSKDGKFVYLLQELEGSLTVFAWQGGKLRRLQETTIVENGFTGSNGGADVHLSPDGQFLYATNRGEANTISIFAVDVKGRLTFKKILPSGGKGPRNFAISPDGKFVMVGHQYTNDITIFSRDAQTGMLTEAANKIELCAPVCLLFVP